MNERSIFNESTGSFFRYASDEYPVPKSSTASRTPRFLRAASAGVLVTPP
jgi:hypothetical protein